MLRKQQIIHENGKKAVLYLRVSSEEQVDNFSLGTQEEICRKEAEKLGYKIIRVFHEKGRSAKTIVGRPMLINLLEYCRKSKNSVNAVIVYRIDRVSRQTADYLAIRKKLAEKNIEIISATEPTGDTPTEKLVETILAGFAQLDNDIRSERARNGLRARYLSGLISGKCPLGYKFQGGFAVKDPETWDKMEKAWNLMATGTKSLSEMAQIMDSWGLQIDRRSKSFKLRPQTVNRIFRQKFYMGIITSRTYPDEPKGQHVPMISEQQFYKVQAILDGRKPKKIGSGKRNASNEDFPLRRIIKCDKCNIGLTAAWSKGRNSRYPYYRCSSKCTKSIKPVDLEEALIKDLKEITPKEECVNLFISFMYSTYHQRLARLKKIGSNAEKEIADLKLTRKLLVEKNLSGVYSDEIFKEQNKIIESKILKAQIVKDDTTIDKYNIDKVTSFIKTMLADLGETYKKSNISQIKVLLGSIFPTGVAWRENGTLNHRISPIYQAIINFDKGGIPSGGGGGIRTHGARRLTLSKRVQLTTMRHLQCCVQETRLYLFLP